MIKTPIFMGRHFLLLRALIAVMVITIMGCGSNPKQIKLTYQLTKDKVYRQKATTAQTVKQTFQGEQQVVKNTIISVMSYRVKATNNETTTLLVSYDTLDLTIQLPDRNMHFTSKGGFYQQNDLFSQLMNAMSGKNFEVTVNNSNGAVIEIAGVSALFESVIAEFPDANGEQISSIMEMLNKSYGESAFRSTFEAMNAYFTNKLLKKGDHWEKNLPLSGINAELINDWRLEEINRKEAVINSKGQLHMLDLSNEVTVEGVITKMELSGTQTAELIVDYKSGWTQSGNIQQHFTGQMHLNNVEHNEQVSLPIEMINHITYLTLE
jgi:hypothetical protein